MDKFVCTDTVVPLRTGPSHKAEMGSQILLGEKFTILDKVGCWTKIALLYDAYSGWVDNDHFMLSQISGSEKSSLVREGIVAKNNKNESLYIFPGSEVYNLKKDGKEFDIGPDSYACESDLKILGLNESICETALRFINAPYLWGGRTAFGIDCSGLSQICIKIHGKSIPRDSFNQATVGTTVNLLSDALPGDLLFFDNSEGKITHVGIFFDRNHIIHASGSVRIDIIDHQGIFNKDRDTYTHKLRLIKRIN